MEHRHAITGRAIHEECDSRRHRNSLRREVVVCVYTTQIGYGRWPFILLLSTPAVSTAPGTPAEKPPAVKFI